MGGRGDQWPEEEGGTHSFPVAPCCSQTTPPAIPFGGSLGIHSATCLLCLNQALCPPSKIPVPGPSACSSGVWVSALPSPPARFHTELYDPSLFPMLPQSLGTAAFLQLLPEWYLTVLSRSLLFTAIGNHLARLRLERTPHPARWQVKKFWGDSQQANYLPERGQATGYIIYFSTASLTIPSIQFSRLK